MDMAASHATTRSDTTSPELSRNDYSVSDSFTLENDPITGAPISVDHIKIILGVIRNSSNLSVK